MTTNSEARKRREEAEIPNYRTLLRAEQQHAHDLQVFIADLGRENYRLRARIAELEARCHVTTDAAGHLSCQTCRRSAEA